MRTRSGIAVLRTARPEDAESLNGVSNPYVGSSPGTALYEALLAELALEDLHRAYAGITMPNPPSVALHRRFGFEQVAYFTEQGRKFGRYWDVAWFEKPL